ncbi:WD40-repeat-containing domain protein [Mucor mucedo]|uniref:WD40-repeat-containing domain protein n=1 Tax=Mucor mucedo TaxID=29922 RepID=UPI00221E4B7B|nr:WD40-repeat-containing domain protein [Mucor mucedo]KAI7896073.1 WD40-repeat-containing domain protein [Mucor mucedo]
MTDVIAEEPSTPVPTSVMSKETRKLRKKKQLDSDEESYMSQVLSQDASTLTDEQIDLLDTDDLMECMDAPVKKSSMKKKKKPTESKKSRPTKKLNIVKTDIIKKYLNKKVIEPFDPRVIQQLALEYPDKYWQFDADTEDSQMINEINADHPLYPLAVDVCDQGAVTGMTLSDDGTLLVTFSNIGAIKIWDVHHNLTCLRHIRDRQETQIDEFYCGQLLPADELLVAGGKLKNRHRWSAEENDNHIMPCPIKIFNIITGERVAVLDGHSEEILCIKAVQFKGDNYLLSTSQDGYIIKWHMAQDWITLLDSTPMIDGVTCMAFTVSFLPNTGNKYFLAACDEHLRLYDFEQAMLLQTFDDMYSSYCDCGKFVNWVDAPVKEETDIEKQVEELAVTDGERKEGTNQFAWFISRGAEMCDVSDGVSSIPNSCILHKLVYPNKKGGKFELQTIQKYTHESYHANSWLVKITSNGRYVLAPTIYGQIFVFNMKTGKVSAIIKEHEGNAIVVVLIILVSCLQKMYENRH